MIIKGELFGGSTGKVHGQVVGEGCGLVVVCPLYVLL